MINSHYFRPVKFCKRILRIHVHEEILGIIRKKTGALLLPSINLEINKTLSRAYFLENIHTTCYTEIEISLKNMNFFIFQIQSTFDGISFGFQYSFFRQELEHHPFVLFID